MAAGFQKWYMGMLVIHAESCTAEPRLESVGFRAHRQVMEVSEAVRGVVAKSDEWGTSACVASLDVYKAFDNMSYEVLAAALFRYTQNATLVTAFLRELVNSELVIALDDVVTQPVPMERGCRQGRTETPYLWRCLLARVLEDFLPPPSPPPP